MKYRYLNESLWDDIEMINLNNQDFKDSIKETLKVFLTGIRIALICFSLAILFLF